MAVTAEHLRQLAVDDCPQCHQRHDFAVRVKSAGTLVFGGGTSAVEIGLRCPVHGLPFMRTLELANNEEFLGLATSAAASAVATAPPPEVADLAEWIKTSRASALDFAKTMLTASSAAVPVYFAVLKYLGAEKLSDSVVSLVSVVPPVLFLMALAIFALGLRPRLGRVTSESFVEFRAERLQALDRYVTYGLVAFVAGLALAGVVFALLVL